MAPGKRRYVKEGDYVELWAKHRNAWCAGYFSWVDKEEITDVEIHTARDGYDSGVTWMRNQFAKRGMTISDEELASEA